MQTTLYLPWRSYTDEPEDPLTGITQTDWLPVQLGRLALPASLCRVTTWEQLPDTVQYSEAAAAALALRACRAALLAEFPDAVIEAEQREISAAGRHRNGSCDLYFHREHRRTAVIRHILLSMTKWLIKFCAIFIVSFAKTVI